MPEKALVSTAKGAADTEPSLVDDPKKWSPRRRWTIVVLLSLFCLISPMSSSMVAPALDDIARDIHITDDFVRQLVLSIFVLTYGIGPVVVGPMSEQYGKVPALAKEQSMLLSPPRASPGVAAWQLSLHCVQHGMWRRSLTCTDACIPRY